MSVPSKETVQKACDYVAEDFRKKGGVFVQAIYDNLLVEDVSRSSDGIPKVTFKLHTFHELRNTVNMVHGGANSTMIALFSFLSLAADTNFWKGSTPTDEELAHFAKSLGMTRSIDVQLIQAVPLDADITIKCHVLSSTRSNAYVDVELYNPSGRLLVAGHHDIMKRHPGKLDARDPYSLKARFHVSRL